MEYQLPLAGGVALFAVLYWYGWLSLFIYVTIHLAVASVAFFYTVKWQLVKGKIYKPASPTKQVNLASILLQKMMEKQSEVAEVSRKVVISRSLDNTLQDIMDLVISDFILSWYTKLGHNQQRFVASVQSDTWQVIEELSRRLSKIDFMKLITQEVVDRLSDHFRDIRESSRKDIEKTEPPPVFVLHPWLRSEETEVAYLRKVCDVLLICLLAPCYKKCHSIRHLLREIITATVLKPSLDLICDPDYINQKLLSYLDYREKLSEDTRRTYTYAATYEDFVKKIEVCDDIEHLKQMRYNIMSEIMHATTINNLKKAQGIKTARATLHEKESSPKSTTKGELLKARNLKRYINQLTVAKSRCEKRIQALGGPDYKYYGGGNDAENLATSPMPGQKVLSFKVIMELGQAREYFMKYLKKENQESLLGFWVAVEKLKAASKEKRHQVASEIYQQYVSSSSTAVKLDKAIIKGMEVFLIGDKGPDFFYDAQKQMYSIMEEKYYPSFIVSDLYHQCISSMEDEDHLESLSTKDELFLESKDDIDPSESPTAMFVDESYHAQQKLQQLDEKLANKTQALHALKSSQKPDEKTKKVGEDIEQEIDKFREERRKLEAHIARTQLWIDHQGSWLAQVHNAEVSQSGTDRLTPTFILVIYLRGAQPGSHDLQDSSQGWVVSRSLDDFYAVHEKLVQIGPWLKKRELPSVTFFKSIDAAFLEKAKKSLNDYLIDVMKDDRMTQSEALYAFLTPSPEYLLQPSTQKKSKFSLANLIKSLPNIRSSDAHASDDEFLFLGEESSKDENSRDSVAKPLYRLMTEVFELRGMFKWLRKSFISFVEISFGRSINKQLREMVDWIISESMLIYYLNTFKDSMWPEGELAEPAPPRTDEEKLNTRVDAKLKILANIPDALKNLVGDDNARQGTIKMFEALQDVRLNKQIVYNFLQVFMIELCPELEKIPSRSESITTTPPTTTSTAVQT